MDSEGRERRETPGACDQFQRLLERGPVDERPLTGEERASLEAHLEGCAECRSVRGFLEALAEVPDQEGALERRVLDSFNGARRHRRIRALAWSSAAVAAAAILALVLLPGAVPDDDAPGETAPAAESSFSVERGDVRAPMTPGPDGRVIADRGPALLGGGEGIRLGLEAEAGVTLPDLDEQVPVLVVEDGRIAMMMGPGAPELIDVQTGAGRIRVYSPGAASFPAVGGDATIIMVEVAGAEVMIDVVAGFALFEVGSPGEESELIEVHAGQGFAADASGPEPIDERRRLDAYALLCLDPGDAAGETPRTGGGQVPIETPEDGVEAVEPPEDRARMKDGARAATAGAVGADRSTPREEPPTAGELIGMARRQRAAGNWSAAADLYRRVLDEHRDRPEAVAVLVPLADLELERLRRPDLALGRYGMYLARMPNGPLGEEALFGRCSAFRALGRTNDEVSALREFIEKYPGSVRAREVKSRLDMLGEKNRY